jgi:hypothetical protein
VNTELRVHSGASNGYNSISLNFSEGSVDTLFHLSWKKC